MAETHIQVNLDGSTEERKTILWPSNKVEQKEVIRSLFMQKGWSVSYINNEGGSFWKIKTNSVDKSWNINLYISSIRDESRQPDEFKMQLGTTYPQNFEDGWVTIVLGIYTLDNDKQAYLLSGYDIKGYSFEGNPSIRGTRTSGLQKAWIYGLYKTDKSVLFRPDFLYYYLENLDGIHGNPAQVSHNTIKLINEIKEDKVVTALRTKPFLLLAGISGTGKSQKVQELAYMTCPEGELRNENGTAPGNYCLVEVKPNWHDSTELLGYYSALSGRYELTDFIRFVYKAIKNETVPFFLCLDEMNLAPVEQYFAEYLSVLETRKNVGGKIQTQPLLKKEVFANCALYKKETEESNPHMTSDGTLQVSKALYSEKDAEIISYLKDNGLSLPDNLFVIGTVNMDDTTHQFSRKVIDRAFTIEMNGGNMADMFNDESKSLLEYRNEDDVVPLATFRPKFVRAYEVLDDVRYAKYAETIKTKIPELLGNSDGTADEDSINGVLNNTPFRVSYRVQNELVLYLSVLIEQAGYPEEIDSLIGEAVLAILLEKVLPRVQGEQKQLATKNDSSNVLKDLKAFVAKNFAPSEGEINGLYQKVVSKLDEMDEKLDNYYTNFF